VAVIRLGSRGSALALAQAGLVRNGLEALGEEVELVTITTSGDERPGGGPAPEPGSAGTPQDKARFTKEIEDALLDGHIDLAVHSAKDVPGDLPEGLAIVGVPARADARDAICGAGSLDELSRGAGVGTASLRRQSQLLARRPDLEIRELRGNVDTRLRKLAGGQYDAIVLACAGLERLERAGEGSAIASAELVPAAGQGCLALEARTGDAHASELAAALTDRSALTRLTAERALVTALGATCHTPVGAYAEFAGTRLRLISFVGMPDGSHSIRDELEGPATEPVELGRAAADRLTAVGALELLEAAEAATI
jgi:hydroxymethylbilane synthase